MLPRVGEKLDSEFVSLGHSGPQHLRIVGPVDGRAEVERTEAGQVADRADQFPEAGQAELEGLDRLRSAFEGPEQSLEEIDRLQESLAREGGGEENGGEAAEGEFLGDVDQTLLLLLCVETQHRNRGTVLVQKYVVFCRVPPF